MGDIVERLRAQQKAIENRKPSAFVNDIWQCAADEIERLRHRNAALVEIVRDSLCPYNGRATGTTVGECQQCGCSHGLMIKPIADGDST